MEEANLDDKGLPCAGDVIAGRLRVVGEIGRGGMGALFLAKHEVLQQPVALKVLLHRFAERSEHVARFLNEARSASRLRHDHIAAVLDVGKLDTGAPYIVLEYLEGEDLARILDRETRLELRDAVDWLLEVMEGIAYAHALGIVHRDLKPSNIFRARKPDGTYVNKVLDFGLAKAFDDDMQDDRITRSQTMLGSPGYMSPEQIHDARQADLRTDVWALGVILYRMLAGREPFEGETPAQLMVEVLEYEPTPVEVVRQDLPLDLAAVVHRCLKKDRRERYPSLGAMAAALAPFASEAGQLSVEHVTRTLKSAAPSLSASRLDQETPPLPRRESRRVAVSRATVADPAAQRASDRAMADRASPSSSSSLRPTPLGTNALSRSVKEEMPAQAKRPRMGPALLFAVGAIAALLAVLIGTGRRAPTEPPPTTSVASSREGEVAPKERASAPSAVPAVVTAVAPIVAEAIAEPSASVAPPPLHAAPKAKPAPAAAPAFLSVDTYPWSRITIDGKPAGDTPLVDVPLAAGPHTVLFTNPESGMRETRVITLAPDEHAKRRFSFQ